MVVFLPRLSFPSLPVESKWNAFRTLGQIEALAAGARASA